jgi:hypothetical protein
LIQDKPPVIVKLIDPPPEISGLAGVLIGSLGLTGFIVLLAIVTGAIFAGILFWYRSRSV